MAIAEARQEMANLTVAERAEVAAEITQDLPPAGQRTVAEGIDPDIWPQDSVPHHGPVLRSD